MPVNLAVPNLTTYLSVSLPSSHLLSSVSIYHSAMTSLALRASAAYTPLYYYSLGSATIMHA